MSPAAIYPTNSKYNRGSGCSRWPKEISGRGREAVRHPQQRHPFGSTAWQLVSNVFFCLREAGAATVLDMESDSASSVTARFPAWRELPTGARPGAPRWGWPPSFPQRSVSEKRTSSNGRFTENHSDSKNVPRDDRVVAPPTQATCSRSSSSPCLWWRMWRREVAQKQGCVEGRG